MPTFTLHTEAGSINYSLSRRTNRNWHYRFWWQNKEHRNTTKQSELGKAREFVEEKIIGATRSQSAPLTVAAAVEAYLDSRWPNEISRLKNTFFVDDKKRLKKFAARFEATITAQTSETVSGWIQTYVNERSQKVSAVSVNNDRRAISRLCAWLMQKPSKVRWTKNPAGAKELKLPRQIRTIKRAADPRHAEKILKAAIKAPIYPVIVLMQSGLRPVGCTRVKWSGIHFKEKPTVEVPLEKGSGREIPLSQWAAKKLQEYKKRHKPTGLVYPYSVQSAFRAIQRLRERSGIPAEFTLGALRRLSYRRLYQAGVSIQLAARIMGSSPATAARHYVDVQTLEAHEEAEALSPLYKPAQKPAQKPAV